MWAQSVWHYLLIVTPTRSDVSSQRYRRSLRTTSHTESKLMNAYSLHDIPQPSNHMEATTKPTRYSRSCAQPTKSDSPALHNVCPVVVRVESGLFLQPCRNSASTPVSNNATPSRLPIMALSGRNPAANSLEVVIKLDRPRFLDRVRRHRLFSR